MSKRNIKKSLTSVFDSFNTKVSDLGDSYRELKNQIEKLNLEIREKNQQLEDNFFEVNRLRLFFNSILNSMTDGVIVIDTSGAIVLFNNGAEKLTGIPASQVIGRHYNDLFTQKVSNRFSPLYTLTSGKSLFHEEKELHIKNGKIIPVRYSTSLVQDNSGNTLGAVEVLSDLTKIKDLEEEMQQIRTQTALNQMAILVSHEIRNPLGGIRGYVDLISESLDEDDPRKEMISHITESISKLDEIVSKFQIYTRPVKPHFEPVDLIKFINDVAEFYIKRNKLNQKNIRVKYKLPENEKLIINIDPVLFEQVILAVFDNSVKAIKNSGTIRIEIKEQISKIKNHNSVHLAIIDSGTGMDSEVCKKAFVPFFTTREKGLGLGLALAKNFVNLHHGQITIESEKNLGTTCNIILPLS